MTQSSIFVLVPPDVQVPDTLNVAQNFGGECVTWEEHAVRHMVRGDSCLVQGPTDAMSAWVHKHKLWVTTNPMVGNWTRPE